MIAGAERTRYGSRTSAYPAPILEPDFELLCDCVGGRLGSALEPAITAGLAIEFRPADNDKTDRIASGNCYGGWNYHSGVCFRKR